VLDCNGILPHGLKAKNGALLPDAKRYTGSISEFAMGPGSPGRGVHAPRLRSPPAAARSIAAGRANVSAYFHGLGKREAGLTFEEVDETIGFLQWRYRTACSEAAQLRAGAPRVVVVPQGDCRASKATAHVRQVREKGNCLTRGNGCAHGGTSSSRSAMADGVRLLWC